MRLPVISCDNTKRRFRQCAVLARARGPLSYDGGLAQAPLPATQRYAWFWENRPLPIGSGSTMQRADAGHDGERTMR